MAILPSPTREGTLGQALLDNYCFYLSLFSRLPSMNLAVIWFRVGRVSKGDTVKGSGWLQSEKE